ncbi:MAG: hypothetical protein R6U40_14465, partial [Desulfobacterales bacterium]
MLTQILLVLIVNNKIMTNIFSIERFFLFLMIFAGCFSLVNCLSDNYVENTVQYVNPFIGTAAYGHTFPGATLPFGMVQL